jgi:hypothetical protein
MMQQGVLTDYRNDKQFSFPSSGEKKPESVLLNGNAC